MASETSNEVGSNSCNAICNQLAAVYNNAVAQGLAVYIEYAHPLSDYSATIEVVFVDLGNCLVYGSYEGEAIVLSCSFIEDNATALTIIKR